MLSHSLTQPLQQRQQRQATPRCLTYGQRGQRDTIDNARMESFYKTLKNEEVDLQDCLDLDDAQPQIDRFIGELYNRERLHSSLGDVPPAEFAARSHSA